MDESQQIIYMQARILRLASKEWGMSIREAARVFAGSKIFRSIREWIVTCS